MNKPLVLTLGILAFTSILVAEPVFDYGSSDELEGVTRVFVYTGSEMGIRNNITKKILKKLPELQFVDRAEDATVHLLFAADISSYVSGMTHWTQTTSSVNYRAVVQGRGLVVTPQDNGRLRLLMEFSDARSTIFERRTSTNFARAFVKAFKTANGLNHTKPVHPWAASSDARRARKADKDTQEE